MLHKYHAFIKLLISFQELYNELDSNRYKIENIMKQGDIYLKKSGESSTKSLQHSLHTLKQRWDNIMTKANDRKVSINSCLSLNKFQT